MSSITDDVTHATRITSGGATGLGGCRGRGSANVPFPRVAVGLDPEQQITHDGDMASRAALAEVAAPDGRLYLIGSGGFVRRQVGGPFSIVAYPFGTAEQTVLRSAPTYTEPIRSADAFYRRLEELTDGIRRGTWTPPALSDSERARLENRTTKRRAKRDAELAWARQHPFAAVAAGTAKLAVVILLFVAIGVAFDLVAGDEVSFPSPVPLLAFLAFGAALQVILQALARSRNWGPQ